MFQPAFSTIAWWFAYVYVFRSAGYVAEQSAYHHGEVSLQADIPFPVLFFFFATFDYYP